jgi:hypothetical protein
MYINSHLLKISIKNQYSFGNKNNNQNADQNTISFKYTVDYPQIELNPYDTKKFSLLYNDSEQSGESGTAIEMVARMS